VTAIAILLAPVIGISVPVYILVRFLLDVGRAEPGRAYITFKAVASLAAWLIASCGWLYMFFVMAYWSGPFVGMESEYGEAASILILDLFYVVIGCALALWVRHLSDKGR
jgi:hypothetical protein